jgi:hypothetical protein
MFNATNNILQQQPKAQNLLPAYSSSSAHHPLSHQPVSLSQPHPRQSLGYANFALYPPTPSAPQTSDEPKLSLSADPTTPPAQAQPGSVKLGKVSRVHRALTHLTRYA